MIACVLALEEKTSHQLIDCDSIVVGCGYWETL